MTDTTTYLYEIKNSFLTKNEMSYMNAILKCVPQGYYVQPQVNLASIIRRTDNARYQNELFRNVDACIFDSQYKPIAAIEINDATHNDKKRKERDKKVHNICEEAGLPIITLWTSYGINTDYITKRIVKAIEEEKNPVRIAHSKQQNGLNNDNIPQVVQTEINLITEPVKEQIPESTPQAPQTSNNKSSKNKSVAVLLSAFFSFFGVPFFYIGRTINGLFMLLFFLVSIMISYPPFYQFLNISVPSNILTLYQIFIADMYILINIVVSILMAAGKIKDEKGNYIKK